MKGTLKHFYWEDPAHRQEIVFFLKNNQTAISTSDTVLGLLANTSHEGYQAFNTLKNRAAHPYIVLIADAAQAAHFVDFSLQADIENIINYCWPGPLTLVLKTKATLPEYVKSPQGTIALRVPQHEGLLNILKSLTGLFSTNANISGQVVAKNLTQVDPSILQKVVCTVGEKFSKATLTPSNIIDATHPIPRILREGAYSIKEIETLRGRIFSCLN